MLIMFNKLTLNESIKKIFNNIKTKNTVKAKDEIVSL